MYNLHFVLGDAHCFTAAGRRLKATAGLLYLRDFPLALTIPLGYNLLVRYSIQVA